MAALESLCSGEHRPSFMTPPKTVEVSVRVIEGGTTLWGCSASAAWQKNTNRYLDHHNEAISSPSPGVQMFRLGDPV